MASPVRSARPIAISLGRDRRVVLREPLGTGASAIVHRAILESESKLRRAVAVKIFSRVSDEDERAFAAAIAEAAQRTACIAHPNVVSVLDVGIVRRAPFLVTELVEGVSLGRLLACYARRRVRPPLDVALFVAVEIGQALEGARTARDFDGVRLGVLHLGLAPSEVLLSFAGEVKVGDFELSLARGATSSIRNVGALETRLAYMAPEIASGEPGDARSDVFSFGVILRDLLVGPRFPRGVTSAEAVRLAREGYVHPACFRPDLPPELVAIVERALEIDPDARFPNAGAMGFELRRIALAMGVGDGRWFLARALQQELREETSEVTRELAPSQHPED